MCMGGGGRGLRQRSRGGVSLPVERDLPQAPESGGEIKYSDPRLEGVEAAISTSRVGTLDRELVL